MSFGPWGRFFFVQDTESMDYESLIKRTLVIKDTVRK